MSNSRTRSNSSTVTFSDSPGYYLHPNESVETLLPTHQETNDKSSSYKMEDKKFSHQRLESGRSFQPLLIKEGEDEQRGRTNFRSSIHDTSPSFSPSSVLRSKSPDLLAKLEAGTRYKYAAFFLCLSLISFVIQTETAVYIQHELGWNKAYCMLYVLRRRERKGSTHKSLHQHRYFTHGSWSLLWPFHLFISRIQKWYVPWKIFWRRNIKELRATAQTVETQHLDIPRTQHSPVPYLISTTSLITCALTIAGGSWYVAVSMTSPSDLTAIYNCSAFFAYAFSVPILGEKPRWDKAFAVGIAILGVLVVAYGDSIPTKHGGKSGGAVGGGPTTEVNNRLAGNLIIGVGSVLYGLYEVLYKRLACPPEGTNAKRAMVFANAFGSLIGAFTLVFLWIPIPILHATGLEKFELPQGEAAWLLAISVLANVVFSGSFLVLISLTSPVLSSVAALLTIFLVAIVDWLWTGVPLSGAAITGGILIIIAFLVLSWSTYREMSDKILKQNLEFSDY